MLRELLYLLLVGYVGGHETQEMIDIDCCQLLQTLNSYTVQSTGDVMNMQQCQANPGICTDRKVIRNFVDQTRAVLRGTVDTVSINNTHIHILESLFWEHSQDILYLAFLGRAVSKGEDCLERMALDQDSLTMIDSPCSLDKTIYTTIVVASISLLVFFIACQVVQDEKRKKEITAVMTPKSSVFAPVSLRMRAL